MTWGIHEVNHVRLADMTFRRVLKLQRGGGHGNTAVFFHLHPVRDGGLTPRLAVDRAGLINNVRMQRQCLSQRGLTSVRVGNDGKRTAARSLSSNTHVYLV